MRSTRLVVVILIVVWLLLLASVGWVFLQSQAAVRDLEHDSAAPSLIGYGEALDSAKKTVFTTHTPEQWAQANKVLVAALANPLFAGNALPRQQADRESIFDSHERSPVPGLYAAGDMVKALDQLAVGMALAATAATAIENALIRNPR